MSDLLLWIKESTTNNSNFDNDISNNHNHDDNNSDSNNNHDDDDNNNNDDDINHIQNDDGDNNDNENSNDESFKISFDTKATWAWTNDPEQMCYVCCCKFLNDIEIIEKVWKEPIYLLTKSCRWGSSTLKLFEFFVQFLIIEQKLFW